MTINAHLRADVDIRANASANSEILDRFPTNCLVEILEDQGDWLKVKPVRLKKTVSGFVPRIALIFPLQPKPIVFPTLPIGTNTKRSVPETLKLKDFRAWLTAGGQPAWIKNADWEQLSQEQRDALLRDMAASISTDPDRWDGWVTNLTVQARHDEATMEEWEVTLQGGKEVYAIRDHYIYKQPIPNEEYFGCATKGQVMLWTGEVQASGQGETRRHFMRVNFYRMNRRMDGWFRADVTQEYVFPEDQNDPEIAANARTVFDLSVPLVRIPQDPEFAAAKAVGFTADQYIDIRRATGKGTRHFCLCGEICTAALGSMDVIPLLFSWKNQPANKKFWRVDSILDNPHEGTSVSDLQSLLPLAGLPVSETYSSIPSTPRLIKQRLENGQTVIAGCVINSVGVVKRDATIRHWVVLEDVLPVGNSGWVRIYNPFHNQEEVYEYNLFMASAGTSTGLWIDPPQA